MCVGGLPDSSSHCADVWASEVPVTWEPHDQQTIWNYVLKKVILSPAPQEFGDLEGACSQHCGAGDGGGGGVPLDDSQ